MGVIPQLHAFVNTREAVYPKKLIPLCVNYTSERADHKVILTEGSALCVPMCVCARTCKALHPTLTWATSIIITHDFHFFCFLLLLVFSDFSQRTRDCFTPLNHDQGSTKEYSRSGKSSPGVTRGKGGLAFALVIMGVTAGGWL